MSIITLPNEAVAEIGETRTKDKYRGASLLRRAFAAIIESRRLSAERRIAVYLEGLSDTRLSWLGYSDAEIASIRAGAPRGEGSWRRARRTGESRRI